MIKNLTNKLIDINILKLDFLDNINDIIYNSELKSTYSIIDFNEDDYINNYLINEYTEFVSVEKLSNKFDETILFVKLIKENYNKVYLYIYHLYLNFNDNFFVKNYEIDEYKIEEIFTDPKINKINYNNITYKERILNYIKQFNEIDNSDVKEPIYLNKYIFIVLFLNNEINDEELINVIKFMHKFNLFILIYNDILELLQYYDFLDYSDNIEYISFYNKIIKILILPMLINKEFIDYTEFSEYRQFIIFNNVNIITLFLSIIIDQQSLIAAICKSSFVLP
jgi:hypothetical protein